MDQMRILNLLDMKVTFLIYVGLSGINGVIFAKINQAFILNKEKIGQLIGPTIGESNDMRQ